LDKAFINFFEGRAKYPTFKKRRHRQSATYTASAFIWRDGTITLAKMREALEIVWSRPLPDGVIPSSVTITKDRAERYFISMLVEEDIAHLQPCDESIGADLGLKSFVVLSDGEIVGNPRFFARDEKKLARAARRHAKKKRKVPRTVTKLVSRSQEFMLALLIAAVTSCTSSRHA
jgi:putative transposase